MQTSTSQIKSHSFPRYAQSGREEGKFYHLSLDVGDTEYSLEAAYGIPSW